MIVVILLPLLLSILSFIFSFIALFLMIRSRRHIFKLTRFSNHSSIDQILSDMTQALTNHQENSKAIEQRLHGNEQHLDNCIQHIGIVRFNPFTDSGGDQSFTLALLNGQHRGVVISSLHGRAQTRLYAKPVVNGRGDGFALSKEEEQAISLALKN